MPPLGKRMPASLPPLGIFLQFFTVDISLYLRRDLLKFWFSSYVFLYTHCPFDRDNIKYEISSNILYYVIPQGQFATPETQAWLQAW